MNDRQLDMMARLDAFSIDGGEGTPDLTFTERLARENGWRISYARRVVEEYKRFLFLAMNAGHRVTPSDQVDQAWHLHMTYTRSYWDRLCTEILGKPLHHDPTRGGAAEDSKFDDWYTRTLESYQHFFETRPPADIWPPSSIRFDHRQRWVRVDASRLWLVRRPRLGAVALLMVLVTTPIVIAGCDSSTWGPAHIGVIIAGTVVLLLAALAIGFSLANRTPGEARRKTRHDGSSPAGSNSGCGGGWWFIGGCGSSSRTEPDADSTSGSDSGSSDGSSSGCGSSGCGGGGCGGGD